MAPDFLILWDPNEQIMEEINLHEYPQMIGKIVKIIAYSNK